MARYLPTRPGWYRNPDDPRSLRYWDGKKWTGRARAQPAWAAGHDPFELNHEEVDRSVEGRSTPTSCDNRSRARPGDGSGSWPAGRGTPNKAGTAAAGAPLGRHELPAHSLRQSWGRRVAP